MRNEQIKTSDAGVRIRPAVDRSAEAESLAEVLLDCVEGGASVSFMHPLTREKAVDFWRDTLASMARGERLVLLAEDAATGEVVGTVQIVTAVPENQPHRCEVAKMLVHRRARRRGVGAALMRAAESVARQRGKTLMVLDTVTGGDAERLYERLGWRKCGVIPNYALLPRGGYCDTTIFCRELLAASDRLAGHSQ